MKRVGIIAASGRSSRTGLSEYTTKAALPLLGRPLLLHQIDFLRRSGFDHVIVVCQPAHVRLLGSFLSEDDRRRVMFLLAEHGGGWGDKIERALPFLDDADEVAIVPCDNYQPGKIDIHRVRNVFSCTATTASQSVTDGPVFGCRDDDGSYAWREHPGKGFSGEVFTGYIVAQAFHLRRGLAMLQYSERGEKEITSLLDALYARSCISPTPYLGEYHDIADLRQLASLDAKLAHGIADNEPSIGAGVLLHYKYGRTDLVLLAQRQDGFGWVPPGGVVDSGESYAHAAARELREEVDIEVDERELRLLGVYPAVGKNKNAACSVIFHYLIDMIPYQKLDSREVSSAGWFTRKEVATLTIPFGLDKAVADCFDKKELDCR
jgi:8-oxo-dGTP pyrophosphatase MutT (NUDIX family)/dTDP-glucose pyrophosphorylase